MIFQTPFAQDVPWYYPTATNNHSILRFTCVPTVDEQPIHTDDYIGVFDESGNCYGLGRWKDTTDFDILTRVSSLFFRVDTINLVRHI